MRTPVFRLSLKPLSRITDSPQEAIAFIKSIERSAIGGKLVKYDASLKRVAETNVNIDGTQVQQRIEQMMQNRPMHRRMMMQPQGQVQGPPPRRFQGPPQGQFQGQPQSQFQGQ